jgi:hypothetical protein
LSVEVVEKPLLDKLIAKPGKSDLTERSTIDTQPAGRGSSTPWDHVNPRRDTFSTISLAVILRHLLFEVPDMAYDESKIEDTVLALLAAFSFEGGRAWKGFDFDVMDRLHAQDFIDNPASKNKSVWLTPQGLERGRKIAERLFSTSSGSAG